jgi:NADP-dependent 3-hydroxy acid dehydrogenase YdfG
MAGVTVLDGKVALITGASRGIGKSVGNALYEAGAHIVRFARSLAPSSVERQTDIPCDIRREEQVAEAVASMLATVGPPHIVVNCAGSFLLQQLLDTATADFEEQIAVNLVGPFLLLRAVVPHVVGIGGHVVTIGSVADHTTFPGNAAYGASKHGLRALHDVLRAEFGDRIRTTLISPGPTNTSIWDPIDPDNRDDLLNRKSMLHADDVADAVLYAVTRPPRANIDWLQISPVAHGS